MKKSPLSGATDTEISLADGMAKSLLDYQESMDMPQRSRFDERLKLAKSDDVVNAMGDPTLAAIQRSRELVFSVLEQRYNNLSDHEWPQRVHAARAARRLDEKKGGALERRAFLQALARDVVAGETEEVQVEYYLSFLRETDLISEEEYEERRAWYRQTDYVNDPVRLEKSPGIMEVIRTGWKRGQSTQAGVETA